MDHSQIKTNGIHLHVAQAGPKDGPLVILLHGFPEFWYGWRHQIPSLADAGYRVWAPDQRGYNLSEKPDRIADYRIDALASDVIGLIDAAGREKAFLIGHDWGAAVAWFIARTDPERLKRMVILNVPHGAVMQKHLRRNPAQRRRSWYIYFFSDPLAAGNALPLGKLGPHRTNPDPQQPPGHLFPKRAGGLPPGLVSTQGVSLHGQLVPGCCATTARPAGKQAGFRADPAHLGRPRPVFGAGNGTAFHQPV